MGEGGGLCELKGPRRGGSPVLSPGGSWTVWTGDMFPSVCTADLRHEEECFCGFLAPYAGFHFLCHTLFLFLNGFNCWKLGKMETAEVHALNSCVWTSGQKYLGDTSSSQPFLTF